MPQTRDLSRRERQFMDVIYRAGRATAAQVQEQMPEAPGYSAVRAMLVRLEKKGHIRHHSEGARYIYSPTISPAAARRDALRQYVRTFFGGSFGQMVTALVRQETWTDEELDALRAEIDRVRKGGRRP